ncbi:MAG: bestrophin family ion channel [Methylococcus sp.]|nr:bestrophin family ion channel [Methylococcus sp.]
MISYNPKSWWGLIFKFHASDTFRRLLPAMVSVALFAAGIAYADWNLIPGQLESTTALHALLGFVISMLLVFRTNTAYERWWDGRKLWGGLTNASRNLALKLNAYLPERHPSRRRLADLIGQYADALRLHLRTPVPAQHTPNRVAAQIFAEITRLKNTGDLSGDELLCLNPELSALAEICGGCERIQKTPIPYSYSLFLKKFIFLYIVSMPFCFVPEFHYWTALITTLVFYVLASLELIAEEIENPFGEDANDLPTDEIAANIRQRVSELLVSSHVDY